MQSFTPADWSKPSNLLRGGILFACLLCASFASPIATAVSDDGAIISVEPAEQLSAAELRELVAPIALYSDELLAIVLPASTYPLQIVAAARYREAVIDDPNLEPDEYWDESIVALLNYPEALDFLNSDLDWTWQLGQAVTDQQADLLAAVGTYRDEAYAAGNLSSDDKHVVAVEDDVVTIKSADPEVIYVPYYSPEEVTIYQTERLYHYYPRPYPVYYYPYSSRHRFYDDHFWGVNSAFVLSWGGLYLGHHLHNHHYHPYFGRRYHRNHYRFTYHYNSPHAYKKRHKHRHKHRDQRPKHRRDHDRWQPDRRWMGDRPHRGEHRVTRTQPRDRHLRHSQAGFIPKGHNRGRQFRTERQRSGVHRSPAREINSIAQHGNRSSVHRPQPKVRDNRFRPNQAQSKKIRPKRETAQRQQRPQRQTQRQIRTQPRARQFDRAQLNRPQRPAAAPQSRPSRQFKQPRDQRQMARLQQRKSPAKGPRGHGQTQRKAQFKRQ